ncbi:MAG: histidine phosphatase family protein [Candidatus Thiodiazotropha sp.]
MRELMLLRHGKSDWAEQVEDFKRPLMDRGRRSAQLIGVWLQQQQFKPDYVISSPAVRAVDTADKTVKVMGLDFESIIQDRRIYGARLEDLLQVLASIPSSPRRVLLVGHNPGLEILVEYLQGERIPLPKDGKLLPTATLARIAMPDEWGELKSGCGSLQEITRASALGNRFPFPDHNGHEMRERPAYYYRQSAVIPYRMRQGKVEFLVIGSQKQKHWVVPKGIVEPGMSLQDSAAKEALEEAGITGVVGEETLGQYEYKKWGGVCTVQVYPMRVEQILPEDAWEESHRGREWVSVQKAIQRIEQSALKKILKQLAKKLEQQQPAGAGVE